MKTTILFTDKVRLLYKEFDHYTPNGSAIYTYIFERLERLQTLDEGNGQESWKKYDYFNSIKCTGDNINEQPNDIFIIEYTRRGKSWDFKLLTTKSL